MEYKALYGTRVKPTMPILICMPTCCRLWLRNGVLCGGSELSLSITFKSRHLITKFLGRMLFIPDIIPPFCEMFNDVRRKLSPIVRWLFCLIWGTRTIFIRLRNKRWESALPWQHSEVFTDSADFSIVVRLWRVFLFRRASSPCVLRSSVWESTRALLSLSFLR